MQIASAANGQKSISNIGFICNLSYFLSLSLTRRFFYKVRKINIYQSAFVHNSHDCHVAGHYKSLETKKENAKLFPLRSPRGTRCIITNFLGKLDFFSSHSFPRTFLPAFFSLCKKVYKKYSYEKSLFVCVFKKTICDLTQNLPNNPHVHVKFTSVASHNCRSSFSITGCHSFLPPSNIKKKTTHSA